MHDLSLPPSVLFALGELFSIPHVLLLQLQQPVVYPEHSNFLINTKINKYIELGINLIRKKLTKKNTPKNTLISRTERFFFITFDLLF